MEQLYYNGTILPMTGERDRAQALLVRDGRIAAVGEYEALKSAEAQRIDLEGKTLLPGFIDGHSHITAAAYQMSMVDLRACRSALEVAERMKAALDKEELEDGQWFIGMGYDHSLYPDGKYPTRQDLDRVSQEIPVAAMHTSGHLCSVNTKAMELLGYLDPNAPVPEGGIAQVDGLLKEQALLAPEKQRLMQSVSPEKAARLVGEVSLMYASYGITTAHDGRTGASEYWLLQNAEDLAIDVVMYMSPEEARKALPRQYPAENPYQGHIRPAGMKLFLDGSPQGKTAWLSRPYLEVPEGESSDYRGVSTMKDGEVIALMKEAQKNHWQINVHANGDEAIEQMIRCYGSLDRKEALRPVIIHCQTVREDQLERMEDLGMLASFFLDHVYYWGDYHRDSVLGEERASRISPLRSALRHHIPFTMHQDTPVVPPNPIFSIHNAVNRRTSSGRVLGEDERISVYEALQAVTINGAYQIFEENHKGALKPGYAADLVILDKNPLEVSPDQISSIEVRETIKDGKSIYHKK